MQERSKACHSITKTYLCNFDPLNPHFYIVKLGFTGVYIIFRASNEYPQSMFWAEIWKISEFLPENFHFLVVKFSIYLNRPVLVIGRWLWYLRRGLKRGLLVGNEFCSKLLLTSAMKLPIKQIKNSHLAFACLSYIDNIRCFDVPGLLSVIKLMSEIHSRYLDLAYLE